MNDMTSRRFLNHSIVFTFEDVLAFLPCRELVAPSQVGVSL